MWNKYYKNQEKRKPREQTVRAVSFVKNKNNALDLGSGNFIESKYLAKLFKRVVAVDSASDAVLYAKKLNNNINFINKSYKEVFLKKSYFDIVNAQYALPFLGKSGFIKFFKSIEISLKKDGVFVGQFFGIRDEWNTKDSLLVFHTKSQILKMLKNFQILEISEEEQARKTGLGEMKHWHVFHVIAKKK